MHYLRCSLTNQKYVPLRKEMIFMTDDEDLNIVLLQKIPNNYYPQSEHHLINHKIMQYFQKSAVHLHDTVRTKRKYWMQQYWNIWYMKPWSDRYASKSIKSEFSSTAASRGYQILLEYNTSKQVYFNEEQNVNSQHRTIE